MTNPTYMLGLLMDTEKQERNRRRLAQYEINLKVIEAARPAIQKEEKRYTKRLLKCTTERQRQGLTKRLEAFCDAQYALHRAAATAG